MPSEEVSRDNKTTSRYDGPSRKTQRRRQSGRRGPAPAKAKNVSYVPSVPPPPPIGNEIECPLCFEPTTVLSAAPCGHTLGCTACTLTALRRLATVSCPLCRESPARAIMMPAAVVSGMPDGALSGGLWDLAVVQRGLKPVPAHPSISATPLVAEYINVLLRFRCALCDTDFRSEGAWRTHLQHRHGLAPCSECLASRPLLPCAAQAYPLSQLEMHRNGGVKNIDPPSFAGHPACSLCGTRCYDEAVLDQHLMADHVHCELCAENGYAGEWFSDAHQLRLHTQREHHVCQRCEHLAAFATTAALAQHTLADHAQVLTRKETAALRAATSAVDLSEIAVFSDQYEPRPQAPAMTADRAQLAGRLRAQMGDEAGQELVAEAGADAEAVGVVDLNALPSFADIEAGVGPDDLSGLTAGAAAAAAARRAPRVTAISSVNSAREIFEHAVERASTLAQPSFAEVAAAERRAAERKRRFAMGDVAFTADLVAHLLPSEQRERYETPAARDALIALLSKLVESPNEYGTLLLPHVTEYVPFAQQLIVGAAEVLHRAASSRSHYVNEAARAAQRAAEQAAGVGSAAIPQPRVKQRVRGAPFIPGAAAIRELPEAPAGLVIMEKKKPGKRRKPRRKPLSGLASPASGATTPLGMSVGGIGRPALARDERQAGPDALEPKPEPEQEPEQVPKPKAPKAVGLAGHAWAPSAANLDFVVMPKRSKKKR